MSFHKVPVLVILLILLLALVVPVSAISITETYYTTNATDGYFQQQVRNQTWDALHDSATANTVSTTLAYSITGTQSDLTDNTYQSIQRTFLIFDTSALPDDATITSAMIRLNQHGIWTALEDVGINIVKFNIDGSISADDFNNFDYTAFSDNRNITAMPTSNTYYNWSLNALGIENISLTSSTGFGVLTAWDIYDTPPERDFQNSSYFDAHMGENGVNLPTLIITYTPGYPNAITNLTKTANQTAINWIWTNATDYTTLMIYRDGVWLKNVTNATISEEWTGLSDGITYTFSGLTCNAYDNCQLWANSTGTIIDVLPMGKLTNAATNLSITTYDGSGEPTHPSVLYVPAGWNGYKYLMAMTPYPNATPILENPSMRYSNDKITWEPMAGADDPIIPYNGDRHNADTNIALVGNTLYLFYVTGSSDENIWVNYTTTTDGVSWATPIKITGINDPISPSFVNNGTGWEAWSHFGASPYNLSHYNCNGLPVCVSTGNVSGISENMGASYQWHSEVKIYDNQYQALVLKYFYTDLYYFNSTDGINWIPSESNPVLSGLDGTSWDDLLYKSSFVETNGTFDVWYTGWNDANPQVWGIGYIAGVAPIASFTTNVTSGTVPLAVGFTDTSTNTPTDWDWYINDVKFSDEQNPEYTFTEAGVYDVSLYAANGASGDWENKTGYITATNWYDLQCENQTGNITINLFSNSTSSLGWTWNDPVNITKIAEDGLYVLSFDNSSDYFIGTGYSPESWHKLKIYNETDFGQLNCTTDAVPVTPTPIPIMPSTESNVNPANLFQYWPYAVLVLGLVVVFKKW